MEPSPGELAPYLIAITAFSLFTVHAMVRFSRALLLRYESSFTPAGRTPIAPAGVSPVARWGWIYAGSWVVLVAVLLAFIRFLEGGWSRRSLLLLLLVVASWFATHFLLVLFIRAIIRANLRAGRPARGAARWERERDRGGVRRAAARGEEDGASSAGDHAAVPSRQARADAVEAAPAGRGARGRVRRVLLTARNLVLVLLVIAIAEAIPPLKQLETYLAAHRTDYMIPLAVIAGIGFVLLMGGAIHMVLAGGRPMERREIEDSAGRTRVRSPGPAVFRRSAYRVAGTAAGAQAEDSATFAEVKAAWRARAWRTSVRWRRLFAMGAGAVLMALGMFGIVIVLAPAGIKLLSALALVYAAVQTTRGFARA